MPNLQPQLDLERCPHCNIANPMFTQHTHFQTNSANSNFQRIWAIYICRSCGGVVSACALQQNQPIIKLFPSYDEPDENIPERAREYLRQAINSIHAPSGAVMLAASSVDAMLKEKELTSGSLYSRINTASEQHLITAEMADWAHEVRLDANDERHADQSSTLPTEEDAKRVIEFTKALAQFLFVLPSKVQRGIRNARGENTDETGS